MSAPVQFKALGNFAAFVYALGAAVSFTLAYAFAGCAPLMLIFLACLYKLAWLPTSRRAYYFGLVTGLVIYTPHLLFFWKTFGYGSVALWYVLPFWLGMFLAVGHGCLFRFGPVAWAVLAPFVWIGFEYYRSELYYLRFSWLNPGYAFSDSPALQYLLAYGVYGVGFVLMAIVSVFHLIPKMKTGGKAIILAVVATVALYPMLNGRKGKEAAPILRVAGIQLEAPSPREATNALERVIAKFPDTDLLVLSEYSFFGPVPDAVKAWCRERRKYLIAGGEEPSGKNFYNTAYVIDTNGAVAFQQAKSVPVQFMSDGLPARQQQVWDSPWGRIGLGLCYDASYTRVMDELVRQGAQALIIPTMDEIEWGAPQHVLHARVGPVRAAELGVAVLRMCSSGVSQFVDASGRVLVSAPFPGDGDMLAAHIPLPRHGRIPPDRWVARLSVGIVVLLSIWLVVTAKISRNKPASP